VSYNQDCIEQCANDPTCYGLLMINTIQYQCYKIPRRPSPEILEYFTLGKWLGEIGTPEPQKWSSMYKVDTCSSDRLFTGTSTHVLYNEAAEDPQDQCFNKKLPSTGMEWYDSDGPTWDCDRYENEGACLEGYANEGLTSLQACCYCGGGDRAGHLDDWYIYYSHWFSDETNESNQPYGYNNDCLISCDQDDECLGVQFISDMTYQCYRLTALPAILPYGSNTPVPLSEFDKHGKSAQWSVFFKAYRGYEKQAGKKVTSDCPFARYGCSSMNESQCAGYCGTLCKAGGPGKDKDCLRFMVRNSPNGSSDCYLFDHNCAGGSTADTVWNTYIAWELGRRDLKDQIYGERSSSKSLDTRAHVAHCNTDPCGINAKCTDHHLTDRVCTCPKHWEGDAYELCQMSSDYRQQLEDIVANSPPHSNEEQLAAPTHDFPTDDTYEVIVVDPSPKLAKSHSAEQDAESNSSSLFTLNNLIIVGGALFVLGFGVYCIRRPKNVEGSFHLLKDNEEIEH